mmetsp:Transcript_10097/g.20082  ORF Transcript_10097/g.20082 Transcript_10097/m.20082 type:complete len:217 (-) Transcript_10097:140-790(-)
MSSMWDKGGAIYWKDKEKKAARMKKAGAVGLCVLLAVAYLSFQLYASSVVQDALGKSVKSLLHVPRPPLSNVMITDCLTLHTNYKRPVNGLCDGVCDDTMTIPPVPGVYRTCLEGCTGGLNAAYSVMCKGGSASDCMGVHPSSCRETCRQREEAQPRPKMHRHCLEGCVKGFEGACGGGKEMVESVVDDHWRHMKKKKMEEVKAMGHDVSAYEREL